MMGKSKIRMFFCISLLAAGLIQTGTAEAALAQAETGKGSTSFARVSGTSTLRLREKADLGSRTLELLSPEAEYEVIGEEGNFAKIAVDTDLVGYVSMDYIDIRVEFDTAVSLSEAAKTAETVRLKSEADLAIKQLEAVKKEDDQNRLLASQPDTSTAGSNFTGVIEANPAGKVRAAETAGAPGTVKATDETLVAPPTNGPTASKGSTVSGGSIGPGGGASTQVVTAARTAVVAYARQFLGNPYVFGGTSLTDGADCSGFTQGVFAHFGITLGRSSKDQALQGREIAVGSVQSGDLLFYGSDSNINHVALYIGDGKIIHASTAKTGITITPSNYRTPCKAVSFLD